jgi:hypothetical protein
VAINNPRRPKEIVMPRFHTIARAVAAAAVTGALAAPAAGASPPASAVQQAQRVQDLRHLEAGNSIRSVDTVDGKRVQDLRHLHAGNSIHSVNTVDGQALPAGPDDGTPWVTIAGIVAAVCLVLGGAAAVGRTRSRSGRARVAV